MKIKIGFWYSQIEPELPMPIKDELSIDEANILGDKIQLLQTYAKKISYKGLSFSRIDNTTLGCNEYSYNDAANGIEWIWPGDFGEHYVRKYRVKPPDNFIKLLFKI